MNHAVDVVVPFRNQATWLQQACRSIHRQSSQDWRAWLVNDHSNPATVAAAEAICRQDPRFRLLHLTAHKPAPGPWMARNLGLSYARAPLVAFLDADDLWHPEKLRLQLPLHQEAGVLSVTSYHRFRDRDLSLVETRQPALELDAQRLLRGNAIPLSTVMVDRAMLQTCGGFKPEHHEDYGLWLQLFHASVPARYQCLTTPLMAYRLHPQSISAKRYGSVLAVHQLFKQHLPRRRDCWPALLRWSMERAVEQGQRRLFNSNHIEELPDPFRSLIVADTIPDARDTSGL